MGATAKGMSATDKELARAASIWKRDVLGVVRDGFVLIARPPAGPGLERAVATSTAVFAFLEDLFRTPTPARKDPEPVSVWVHADRNDLWAHLSPIEERWADDHLRGLDGKKREHAAFFSPGEGLTKILSPDIPGTPEREAEIREDLAFCTTSHWLYARCPRFRWTETHESEKAPCCFVQADYLVSAVCRGAVDAKGGWALPDHAGVVFRNWKALKEMRKAAAWANVLDVSQKDLRALAAAAGENDTEVSEFDAYATQARLAALWFAYGADEGVRRRYADHLTDYELGRADLKTVRSVYGVDPVEFGRRIDEWASK